MHVVNFPTKHPRRTLKLSDQPVLVIEIPRELVNEKTSLKYFNQSGSTLDLDSTIFTGRWQFIGQFLLFHTKEEQVRSQSSTISNYFVFLVPCSLLTIFIFISCRGSDMDE
jgi:hypothetical protein